MSDVDTKQADIDALAVRIANGEALLKKIASEEERRTQAAVRIQQLSDQTAEVETLEALVTLFGPKGLKAELLATALGKLQARADARMIALTGGQYRLQFSAEGKEGFQLLVFRVGWKRWRKPSQLSGSERKRVGIVIQDVLNGLTGLGILMVDEAQDFDPPNKSAFIALLMSLAPEYGTIIALSTLGETVPHNPGIEGLSMFMVETGIVTEIEPGVTA